MKLLQKLILPLVAIATFALTTPAQAGWFHHHRYYRGYYGYGYGSPYYGYYSPGYYGAYYSPYYYGGGVGFAFGGHGYRGGFRGGHGGGHGGRR